MKGAYNTDNRDTLDRYYTPPEVVYAMMQCGDLPGLCHHNHTILEPCAGGGSIVRVLRYMGYNVVTGDVDQVACKQHGWDHQWDFIRAARDGLGFPTDWIITNPPYTLPTEPRWTACDFALESLKIARVGVAMLVRQSFLEPTIARSKLFAEYSPAFIYQLPRVSFTADGARDMVSHVWIVWLRGPKKRPWQFATEFKWIMRHDLEDARRTLPVEVLTDGDGFSDLPLFEGPVVKNP